MNFRTAPSEHDVSLELLGVGQLDTTTGVGF
jgi:hypothetical protein